MVLVRPGIGARTFSLPPGSTLGDLLREAGSELGKQDALMTGGQTLKESDVLPPGAVVFLIPRPRCALVDLVEDEILGPAGLTEEELRQEIAIVLFQRDRLTLAQASHLAGLDRLAFQRLLSLRQIPIHYDEGDFEADLKTLRRLGRL